MGVDHGDTGKYSLWLSVGDHLPVDRMWWTVVCQSIWADIGLLQTTAGPPVITWFVLGTLSRRGVCELFSKVMKETTNLFQGCQKNYLISLPKQSSFLLQVLKKKKIVGEKKPSFKHVLKVKFLFCSCCFWEKNSDVPWPRSIINYPIVFLKYSILKTFLW